MNQPLLALSNGELLRLSACLRSQPLIPNEAALNQQQIARENPELRRALLAWLENWNHQGGNNGNLELTLSLLLDQRQSQLTRQAELVWSGPQGGAGDITRDQAILIREMVERCEKRLLITTFNIWRGGFIAELLNRVQQRLLDHPSLDARMVVNIPRPRKSTVSADQLRQAFIHDTWRHLWDNERPKPLSFFDPRSLDLTRERPTVFHVKCCVADDDLLVTSANLTDSAQLENCELGIHFPGEMNYGKHNLANGVWNHFDRLIHRHPPALVPVEAPMTESRNEA